MNTQRELLSPAQASQLLGVGIETLRRWRRTGTGPPARRLGPRLVRYDRDAVLAWLETRETA